MEIGEIYHNVMINFCLDTKSLEAIFNTPESEIEAAIREYRTQKIKLDNITQNLSIMYERSKS